MQCSELHCKLCAVVIQSHQMRRISCATAGYANGKILCA